MATIAESFILFFANRFLRSVNLKSHPLYPLYQDYFPLLKDCYKDTFFWHGTGRFHYKLLGNSKYEGVDFSKTYDVLQSIIDEGGISPKLDPILKVNGKYLYTISLTKYRMYGRAYAEFNQYKQCNFEYVYGSVAFWYYFLAPIQLLHGNLFQNLWLMYKASFKNKKFINDSQAWMFTFRQNNDDFKWTALNFYKVRSDIPYNYGILFGIKKSGVHPVTFNKIVERFETRADNIIQLKDITHIEVTLSKVKEIEKLLKQNNINIPVIPIEIGELYCSQFSLAYLSGINNLVKPRSTLKSS